uniref:Anaphase-promoting complex subunit 10 n=1 Tax=Plectus sambesii TaxID=2011161 RepID=A0A914WD19_9BILA
MGEKPSEPNKDWRVSLPENAGELREVGDQAIWSLSSCKSGYGVDQLLDDSSDTYWQSDGPQPHLVNIQFSRKTTVSFLLVYVDYKADESYTPSKIAVRIGSSLSDLREVRQKEFTEPAGWQIIDLRMSNGRPSRAFVVQLAVIQNHQNGRDTHIRQVKIVAPSLAPTDQLRQPLVAAESNAPFVPPKFLTVQMNQFAVIR